MNVIRKTVVLTMVAMLLPNLMLTNPGWTASSQIQPTPRPQEDQFYRRYFQKGDQVSDPEEYQRKIYEAELKKLNELKNHRPPGTPTPALSSVEVEIVTLIGQLGQDERQMIMAMQKLVNIGEETIPLLRQALQQSNKQRKIGALMALRKLYAEQAILDIQNCLTDQASEVRIEALKTIGRLRHGPSVKLIIPLLNDPQRRVRLAAVDSLGRMRRSPAAEAALIRTLDQNFSSVKKAAAQSLSAFSSAHVVEALIRATYENDPDLVALSLRALGEIGSDVAFDRVKKLANHKNRFIAREALSALENIKIESKQ